MEVSSPPGSSHRRFAKWGEMVSPELSGRIDRFRWAVCALPFFATTCVLPIVFAAVASNVWVAVGLIGLAKRL